MSAVDAVASGRSIRGREAGFFADLWSIAGRALRLVPRDKEALIPALIIPVFFFAVNIGQLQSVFAWEIDPFPLLWRDDTEPAA